MDILGLIIEALDGGELALHAAHAPADEGAFLPQLDAVLEEHQPLDEVLVGPQALEAVGGKAGQQLVPQGQLRAVRKGDGVQLPVPGEDEPHHPGILRHGERRVGQGPLIEHRVGVHHQLGLVLGVDLHLGVNAVHRDGIPAGSGIDGPVQALDAV